MINSLIGIIDWPAALAFVALVAGIVAITSVALTRPTSRDREDERMLKREEIRNSKEIQRLRWEQEHELQLKRLEQNLITSHRETDTRTGDGG